MSVDDYTLKVIYERSQSSGIQILILHAAYVED